ncbi:MAG: Yip1 family protein [Anaerolineae bacterium]
MAYEEPYGYTGDTKTPAMQIWRDVLLSPSVEAFARYRREAELKRGLVWIVVASLASTLSTLVTMAIQFLAGTQYGDTSALFRELLPPELYSEMPPMSPGSNIIGLSVGTLVCGIPVWIATAVIGTLISVGLIHLAAKLLGGEGEYDETFFFVSTVMAPLIYVTTGLSLFSSLLGLIPVLSIIFSLLISLVSLALGIYSLVLEAMAVAAAHYFSLGKGFAAVLLPIVIAFLLMCCCVAIVFSVVLGGSFEEIMRELSHYLPATTPWFS